MQAELKSLTLSLHGVVSAWGLRPGTWGRALKFQELELMHPAVAAGVSFRRHAREKDNNLRESVRAGVKLPKIGVFNGLNEHL